MKYLLIIYLILGYQLTLIGQFKEINISTGVVHSDLHGSSLEILGEQLAGKDLNRGKIGFYTAVGASYNIWKWISINGSLTYQERWPLEIFRLNGNSNFGVHTLGGWPSSPQSDLWDPSIYPRFPNFKYLHLDIIPTVSFGKKLNISVGVGIFYGHLLNKNKLVFGRKDFPSVDWIFEEPFNVSGEVKYTKHDIGWIPTFNMNYPISSRLKLGISMKAYISQYALNENRYFPSAWGRRNNATWMVFTGGIELRYVLKRKEKEKK